MAQIAVPKPFPPDRSGFYNAVKALFPDDLLTLRQVLILFWLIEHEEWSRVEKMILALRAAGEITQAQYAAIKADVAAKRIPVTLPW